MAYPTKGDCQAYIDTTGDDTVIQQILDGTIETVETYCNRKFVTTNATRNFPASHPFVTRRGQLLTFFEDLQAVTSITNGNGDVLTTADYDLIPVKGAPFYQIMLRAAAATAWQEDTDGTRIVIIGNWARDATCPADIFLAILQLVQLTYAGKSDGAGVSITPKGGIVDKAHWPDNILRVLDGKKRS